MSELGNLEAQSDICKICGIGRIDFSENSKSCICKKCREEKIRYPIPKIFYGVVVILIALICIAMVQFPSGIKMYKTYKSIDKRVADGYTWSALLDMNEMLEKYPNSLTLALKATDIAMEHDYYDKAAYYIHTYIEGKTLEDGTYNRITQYANQLNVYYNTADAIQKIYTEAVNKDPDDVVTYLQSQFEDLLMDSNYDQALVYYSLGYIEPDNAKRIEYMHECLLIDPNNFYATAEIANVYRRQGDLSRARKLLESVYQRNKEASAILRSLSVVEMLEGNLEQGLIYAESAYKNGSEGNYVADTYIIALYSNGQAESAKQVKAECEGKNYYFDEQLESFLNGSISLQEYYVD